MKLQAIYITAIVFLSGLNKLHAQNHTLLYEISKDNIETSYLYGTIHMMPKAQFKMGDEVKDAFAKAEKVILELDMDDPGLQADMMKHVMFTDGTQLTQLFTEQEQKMVDSVLTKDLGMNLMAFNTMKPFIINTMLVQSFFGKELASYEETFIMMAGEQGKEILGLETVAEQFAAVDAQSYEDQADDIVEFIEESEETQKLFNKMLELYLEGDADKLYTMTREFYDGDDNMVKSMLDQRNANWIPVLEKQMAQGSRFVGVGAAHLGGENGVIQLLRDAGYKVTPVNKI